MKDNWQTKEDKERQIKNYYDRMDALAKRIEELARRNIFWRSEFQRWKNMHRNVKYLEKLK